MSTLVPMAAPTSSDAFCKKEPFPNLCIKPRIILDPANAIARSCRLPGTFSFFRSDVSGYEGQIVIQIDAEGFCFTGSLNNPSFRYAHIFTYSYALAASARFPCLTPNTPLMTGWTIGMTLDMGGVWYSQTWRTRGGTPFPSPSPIVGMAENYRTYRVLGPFSIEPQVGTACPQNGTFQAYFTFPFGGSVDS